MDSTPTFSYDSFPDVSEDMLEVRLASPPDSPLPLTLDDDFVDDRQLPHGSLRTLGGLSARTFTSSSGSSEFSYERTELTVAMTDAETLEPGGTLTNTSDTYVLVSDRRSSCSASSRTSSNAIDTLPIGRMVGSAVFQSAPIRRVRISDQSSGLLYLDVIYRWPENRIATENIGSMIQAFYQFARELNSGEVVSVSFEAPLREHPEPVEDSDGHLPGPMTLLCISERGVIFALFFEPEKLSAMQDSGPKLRPEINENEIMKSVLVAIKDSFLGAFEEILESIKASLHALRTSFPESHWRELNASAEVSLRAPLEAFRTVVIDTLEVTMKRELGGAV